MKIAVSFEPATFKRIHEEAEDRGCSISEQVDWLVRRCWWLERERETQAASAERLEEALREREKRKKLQRDAWEKRNA